MPSQINQTNMTESVLKDSILDQWGKSKNSRRKFEMYWNKAINETFFPEKESIFSFMEQNKKIKQDNNLDDFYVIKKLDTRYYLPSNIKAKISTKKELIIEAIQTENRKDDVGCFEICSYRGMTEVLQIPDHINADDIDVSLLESGDLLITVPRSSVVKKDQTKEISGPEVEKVLEIRMNDSRSCEPSETKWNTIDNEAPHKRCQTQQNSSIKEWDQMFEDFFLPIIQSYTGDDHRQNENEKQRHKAHASSIIKNFVVERLNVESEKFLKELINSESAMSKKISDCWDKRFNSFFLPIFNRNEFLKLE